MPQGHPGQLLCWDRGLYHLCSKRGNCAYALSQCTQQGEAHSIYLGTCSLFWVVGGKWFSLDWTSETGRQTSFHIWDLKSPEWRYNWLRTSWKPVDKQQPYNFEWSCICRPEWHLFGLFCFCFCLPRGSNFSYFTRWMVCYRRQKKEVCYFWYDRQVLVWGLYTGDGLLSCLLSQRRDFPILTHNLDFWLLGQA